MPGSFFFSDMLHRITERTRVRRNDAQQNSFCWLHHFPLSNLAGVAKKILVFTLDKKRCEFFQWLLAFGQNGYVIEVLKRLVQVA